MDETSFFDAYGVVPTGPEVVSKRQAAVFGVTGKLVPNNTLRGYDAAQLRLNESADKTDEAIADSVVGDYQWLIDDLDFQAGIFAGIHEGRLQLEERAQSESK